MTVLRARADLSGKQVFYCKKQLCNVAVYLYWYLDCIRCSWIIRDDYSKFGALCHLMFNLLTSVSSVTARDEPWPFFLFWRHDFWPILAPSILNFCRRKRSFQWCPDQSDQPNAALDMRKKILKKLSEKLRAKFSQCHYTWLLHAKNCPSRWGFLRSLTASKPSRRSIAAAKRREKEIKERRKKIPKIEKA